MHYTSRAKIEYIKQYGAFLEPLSKMRGAIYDELELANNPLSIERVHNAVAAMVAAAEHFETWSEDYVKGAQTPNEGVLEVMGYQVPYAISYWYKMVPPDQLRLGIKAPQYRHAIIRVDISEFYGKWNDVNYEAFLSGIRAVIGHDFKDFDVPISEVTFNVGR